ncbi:MAG: XdhC family protein [Thiohalobacteraceae bacterium]
MRPLYDTDREILQTAIGWLEEGHRPLLVTVAKTWGSSPRPVGSLMLLREDGVYSGSVSGGCVEEDLSMRYRDGQLGDRLPTSIDYGVERLEAARLGLPCGGRLELVLEMLDEPASLRRLLDRIDAHQLVLRRVCLQTGEVQLQSAVADDGFEYATGWLQKVFGPRWEMLLIGAGQLSQYVASLATMLGYRVFLCDPREQAAWNPAGEGVEQVAGMPDDAVKAVATHARIIVLALSHDPKLDDMALLEALASPAFYVGAIGSARNSAMRRERLLALGMSPQQVQRLHAPAGLPIGSHAPPEIALSILAEITALRNQRTATVAAAVDAA